jgi:alkaline phosphatase D
MRKPSDPDLQAAHARAAFICVWDDHEVANNAWTGGADNHQPEREGSWANRKAAALQAWFEWMPIRDTRAPPARAVFRAFRFGDLATLFMLETRLLARASLPAELREGASPRTTVPRASSSCISSAGTQPLTWSSSPGSRKKL